MPRSTRIYVAIDQTGEPTLARTVKHEMFSAIVNAENKGLQINKWTYWSISEDFEKIINKIF